MDDEEVVIPLITTNNVEFRGMINVLSSFDLTRVTDREKYVFSVTTDEEWSIYKYVYMC